MKFFIVMCLLMSFSVQAKSKSISLLSVEETNNLCPQLGNWSGIYTQGEAFMIECSAPQARVIFNAFRSNAFTQITRTKYSVSALITDKSEAYDILNSVGTLWRGRSMEIVCRPMGPGSRFAEWCRVTKYIAR